jgi:hypothetical protein
MTNANPPKIGTNVTLNPKILWPTLSKGFFHFLILEDPPSPPDLHTSRQGLFDGCVGGTVDG